MASMDMSPESKKQVSEDILILRRPNMDMCVNNCVKKIKTTN